MPETVNTANPSVESLTTYINRHKGKVQQLMSSAPDDLQSRILVSLQCANSLLKTARTSMGTNQADVDALATLQRLTSLTLGGDEQLQPCLACLSQLSYLQELVLEGGLFFGLESLQHVTKLELSSSQAQCLGTGHFCTTLRVLSLDGSKLVGMGNGGVGACTALERLTCVNSVVEAQAAEDFFITPGMDISLPAVMTTLTFLTSLHLSAGLPENAQDDDMTYFEVLSDLSNLRHLHFQFEHGCTVSGGLSKLAKLTSLSFSFKYRPFKRSMKFDLDWAALVSLQMVVFNGIGPCLFDHTLLKLAKVKTLSDIRMSCLPADVDSLACCAALSNCLKQHAGNVKLSFDGSTAAEIQSKVFPELIDS